MVLALLEARRLSPNEAERIRTLIGRSLEAKK
jgi:hypothetical protein